MKNYPDQKTKLANCNCSDEPKIIRRLPVWFRQDIPDKDLFLKINSLSAAGVNTVCQEARCPNISRCFKDHRLTFMILGDTCTRNCLFCAVKKSKEEKLKLDAEEPYRVAKAVSESDLRYIVITSVTRDDLADGGSGIFAQTIRLIRENNAGILIETLIPDFCGDSTALKTIIEAGPACLAHNIETVRSLYKQLRPQADYARSLRLLHQAKEIAPGLVTKSSLVLGLGEKEDEVIEVMRDLKENSVDILALGQYLSPSSEHYPVKEFIGIEQFHKYRRMGMDIGFKAIASGPLVRSSYQAQETYEDALCMT